MLSNEVECDEAYVIAGHKGHPEVVKEKGRKGRRRRLQGKCGRVLVEKEMPSVFGMMQRGGALVPLNVQTRIREQFFWTSRLARVMLLLSRTFLSPGGDHDLNPPTLPLL